MTDRTHVHTDAVLTDGALLVFEYDRRSVGQLPINPQLQMTSSLLSGLVRGQQNTYQEFRFRNVQCLAVYHITVRFSPLQYFI